MVNARFGRGFVFVVGDGAVVAVGVVSPTDNVMLLPEWVV